MKAWSCSCRGALRLGLALLAPLLCAAGTDISRYRIPMGPGGLLAESDTQTLAPWSMNLRLVFGYADKPLLWRYDDNTYERVISQRVDGEVSASLGIIQFVDVGIASRLTMYQDGPTGAGLGDLRGAGVGDLRLMPRIQFADERTYGYGGALIAEVILPTGEADKFRGNGTVAFRPKAIGSYTVSDKMRVLASLALHLRSETFVAGMRLEDDWEVHAGASYDITNPYLPFYASAELTAYAPATFSQSGQTTLEALLGGHGRVTETLLASVGFGVGLSSGIGQPNYRVLLGMAFSPKNEDQDGDGIADSRDQCPYVKEDRDDFDDGDGCPEPDNDGDGIDDIDDKCPNEAEDFNAFEDEDGCPDKSSLDTDKDGIVDAEDRCPTVPEDFDDFKDEDGCPETDNDIDGVPDSQDQCPDEKETINGIDDEDGCADEGEGVTQLVESQIEIKETILFESGKAILKAASKPILDQVALQILAHPEIIMVRIEGHTDSYGDANANLMLSQERAEEVRQYLIGRGIAPDRLQAEGFGESVPIASNATRAGRSKNRRVDFVIIQEAEPIEF